MRSRLSVRPRAGLVAAGVLTLWVQQHAGGAQDWHAAIQGGLVQGPVVGLLNMPEIVGPECVPSPRGATVRAYGTPSTSGPVVGSIELRDCSLVVRRQERVEELPTTESGYEFPAAVVLQRSGRWFRIALQQGSAWVESSDATSFHAYPELLTERLAYLRPGWDGRLWESPDAAGGRPAPAEWTPYFSREIPIAYLGSRRVGGRTWVHVRLDLSAGCGEAGDRVRPVSGWIPAFRPSGEPSAWFYSRGC